MSKPRSRDLWVPVVFADDMPLCACCGEPYCAEHNDHFADCACPGPTQDDLEYRRFQGKLECRPKPS